MVLAHAVILIDADLSAAHQAANAFRSAARQRAGLLRLTGPLLSAQLLPGERHLLPRFSEALAQSWTRLAEGRFQVAAEGFHRATRARGMGTG